MFKFITTFLQCFKKGMHSMRMPAFVGKLPAIPYDENSRPVCVPMVAILDGSGNIAAYLPIAAYDNGDGTASIRITN